MDGIFLIWIVQAFVMASIPAMIANSKEKDVAIWFFYGFLVWPIALVHALLIPPGNSVSCRFCAKHISREAKVCPYCQLDLATDREPDKSTRSTSSFTKMNDTRSDLLILPQSYRSRGQPIQESTLQQQHIKEEARANKISNDEDTKTIAFWLIGFIVFVFLSISMFISFA